MINPSLFKSEVYSPDIREGLVRNLQEGSTYNTFANLFDDLILSALVDDTKVVSAYALTAGRVLIRQGVITGAVTSITTSAITSAISSLDLDRRLAFHRAVLVEYITSTSFAALERLLPYHEMYSVSTQNNEGKEVSLVLPAYLTAVFPWSLMVIPQREKYPSPRFPYPSQLLVHELSMIKERAQSQIKQMPLFLRR